MTDEKPGITILHCDANLCAAASASVFAIRLRSKTIPIEMAGYWVIQNRHGSRIELGRGKTLRAALRSAGIDRNDFKNGKA